MRSLLHRPSSSTNGFSASLSHAIMKFLISHRTVCQHLHRQPHRAFSSYHLRGKRPISMAQTNGVDKAAVPAESSSASPRKLKILMLHGYTQSGPLFHAKTRALEKILLKAFPPNSPRSPLAAVFPGGPALTYPTGPILLLPADIPGYQPTTEPEDEKQNEVWGWWRRESGSGRYLGLEDGLDRIAEAIREVGGIDGVVGFSQGAAAAALVASLLQSGRKEAFDTYIESSGNSEVFRYPKSWEGLRDLHPDGLKFAVCYSGFYAPNELYRGFYEPGVECPVLHVIGSLDSVVEESRSLALVEVTRNSRTVYHPGGHFVPTGKEMAGVLVGFIRECCEVKQVEVSVEEMNVPF